MLPKISLYLLVPELLIYWIQRKLYGLNPQVTWNYGLSLLKKFFGDGRNADVVLIFTRTDFQKSRSCCRCYAKRTAVLFYNLKGKSVANIQVEFNYEIALHHI
jgi:hypothetical protein